MSIVLKFGGSSVANHINIKKVIDIILQKQHDQKLYIVVSALGGTTDLLLTAAEQAATQNSTYIDTVNIITNRHLETIANLFEKEHQHVHQQILLWCKEIENLCNGLILLGELSNRSKDKIVSYGEIMSSFIIAEKLKEQNINTTWHDSRQLIKTNNYFGNAQVNFKETNKNISAFTQNITAKVVLLPGFIAANADGITTTLGRGGSDYTAAIIAAALQAQALEIWTDVSGMMTADPRLVSNYKNIPEISYQEAMELCHFGAKVVYPPTIQPVMKLGIPVWVKNTFAPHDHGTLIKNEAIKSDNIVCGISSIKNISLLSLEGAGMLGIPGFSKRLFEALALQQINVILITQSSSEHSICVGIDAASAAKAKQTIDLAFSYEIENGIVDPLSVENDLAIVAVVGENMKNHTGVSGRMFYALGRNGVNIRAIAQGSSERNISAVISQTDVNKAINVLHEAFFESEIKLLNLFIAGVGTVGSKLITQIQQQAAYLKQEKNLLIRVIGIANSKQFIIDENGIDLTQYKNQLLSTKKATVADYAASIVKLNLRNSIFVDVTASESVALVYNTLLQKSIAVVACNKVAASSDFEVYKLLKQNAKEYSTPFLFETNVGAGLPVIGTLNDLVNSGDKVNSIHAVLSGTLNFVFNNYDGSRSFAEVVRQAQTEGYTEPDPRLDLSGKDVMRKILILAREAGLAMQMEDIDNNSFMPDSCMTGSVEDFYTALAKEEAHFQKLLNEAQAKNCKLKFVATLQNGKANVGLQYIDEQHNFYHLYGKDNIVQFYTERYQQQPLVIKGAGAGADVTASGVFADIIRVSANN